MDKIKDRTIRVCVIKRIQEENFEPFEIQLEESITYDNIKNPKKLRKKLYKKLAAELDDLIDKRLDELDNS